MKKTIALVLLIPGLSWAGCFGKIMAFSQDQAGNSIISFQITNGTQIINIDDHVPFGSDANQPGEFVASECSGLQTQSVGFSSATAVGQIIPPYTVGASVNLFAVQEAQFLANLNLLRQYKEAINYGLITTSDTNYQAVLSSATNEYAVIESTVTPLMPGAQ